MDTASNLLPATSNVSAQFDDLANETQLRIAEFLRPRELVLQVLPGGQLLNNRYIALGTPQLARTVIPNRVRQWSRRPRQAGPMLEDDPQWFNLAQAQTVKAWFRRDALLFERDGIPEYNDFNHFRATNRQFRAIANDVLQHTVMPIMLVSYGIPNYDQLDPMQQALAQRAIVVQLRYGWSRYADITPFLERLPSIKYVMLPARWVTIRLSAFKWNAERLHAGIQIGAPWAYHIVVTALQDMLPQNWQFRASGKTTRVLSEIIIENSNEQDTDVNAHAPNVLKVVLAQDISCPSNGDEIDPDTYPFVMRTDFDPLWSLSTRLDEDLIALSEQYDDLDVQNPNIGRLDLARFMSRAAPAHETPDQWQEWYNDTAVDWLNWWNLFRPTPTESFKSLGTWRDVSSNQYKL